MKNTPQEALKAGGTIDLNDSLVVMCTNLAKTYRNGMMFDDLLQEGLLACYEALGQYDAAKYEDKPEKYFYFKALGGMSDYYNRRSRLVQPPKGYKAPLEGDPTLEDTKALRGAVSYVSLSGEIGEDLLQAQEDHAYEYECDNLIKVMCSRVFERLNDEEREILNLRYFSYDHRLMSLEQVGKSLKPPVSRSYVGRALEDIFKKLK